ncbi:copper resistance protein CopC [Kocuria soli]|uniref:Copper resistance protein CopC n=1 Tax=Kocuria soli TaxID=2485125 RepID=A0A3N3ZTK7_9MICC|nr:copper resistance protein CopC [Kocuria soli]
MPNPSIAQPTTATDRRPDSRGRRALRSSGGRVGAGVAVAALVALPSPVWAHDSLLSSTPGDDARVSEAPDEVEMTFSADLLDVGHQVRVTDSSGADVTDGEPTVEGSTVTQELTASDAQDETYTVVWRVVSSDGHPIEGTFTYDLGEGSASGGPSATDTAAAADSSGSPQATTGGEATETSSAGAPAAAEETGQESGGAPLWLYAGGGAVLALVVLGAVVAVRRIGGHPSDH